MIQARFRQDPLAAILGISATVMLAGTLAFMLFAPKPTTKGMAAKFDKQAFQTRLEIKTAQQHLTASKDFVARQTWTGATQDIDGVVMSQVSRLSQAKGLKLVQLRPQRPDPKATPVQLPFLVTLEGPYPAVVSFLSDLENPSTRLAINLVQISAAEASSDKVTANVGLVAYQNPAVAETATSTKSAPAPGGPKGNA